MTRNLPAKRGYSLDHLRWLQVLLEEESVTRAARRLRVSEAAASRHLASLRTLFGDPLLVLSGRQLVPTPFAADLLGRVQTVLAEAEALVSARAQLDLSQIAPHFTIRARDLFIGAFGSAIAEKLRESCPRCQLVFSPETEDSIGDALRRGTIDLYIGATEDLLPEIKKQTLFQTRFEAVVRAGHPILDQEITPQTLVAYDHISTSRKGRAHGPIDAVLAEKFGLERRIALVVPSDYAMIETMRETDMILPLPEIIIRRLPLEAIGARAFVFPFPLPDLVSFQAWHPRLDNDPVHRWLRETILTTVQSVVKALRDKTGSPQEKPDMSC